MKRLWCFLGTHCWHANHSDGFKHLPDEVWQCCYCGITRPQRMVFPHGPYKR